MQTELKLQEYLQGVRKCVAPFELKEGAIIWADENDKVSFNQPRDSNTRHEVKVYPFCYDSDESGHKVWLADNEIPDSIDVVVHSDNANREMRTCFRPMDYALRGLDEFSFTNSHPALMDYHPRDVEDSRVPTVTQAFDDAIHFALGLQIAYDISCGGLAQATIAGDAAMLAIEKPSREFLALLKHNDKSGFYATTMALIPVKLDEEYAALVRREHSIALIPVSAESVVNREVFVGQVSWFERGDAATLKATPYLLGIPSGNDQGNNSISPANKIRSRP
jgi:hypothetical protein